MTAKAKATFQTPSFKWLLYYLVTSLTILIAKLEVKFRFDCEWTLKVYLHQTKANANPNCFLWSLLLLNVNIKRILRAHSHRAKAETKAKILFEFFLWSLLLPLWSFSFSLGVKRPLHVHLVRFDLNTLLFNLMTTMWYRKRRTSSDWLMLSDSACKSDST